MLYDGTVSKQRRHRSSASSQSAAGSLRQPRSGGRGNAARAAALQDQQGSVRLRLPGSGVTPPRFPGGLAELHDWLMDNQAALRGWAGDIIVTVRGTLQQTEQVTWTYYHPHQQLVLRGKRGAEVTGFRGREGTKTATPGYFLAYRPRIPQAMSADNPAAANLKMTGLTVKGFVAGGVEISPRKGQMPDAQQWALGVDPDEDRFQGGKEAWVSGAEFRRNTFEQMGTQYLKKGRERYDPGGEDYGYAGYGAIIGRGVNASTFAKNRFEDLENRNSKRGDGVNWRGLIHGIYLRDDSSDNSIRKNRFDEISGAPVKFTNDASRNKVRKNRADDAGRDAFVLDHYNPNDTTRSGEAREPEADSEGYSNERIRKADDGKRYIHGNRLGRTNKRWKKRDQLEDFREKGLKKR